MIGVNTLINTMNEIRTVTSRGRRHDFLSSSRRVRQPWLHYLKKNMEENIVLISIIVWSANVVITWQGFNRNKIINYSNVLVAIILCIWGFILYPRNIQYEINSNIAGVLFTPLIFVIVHLIMSKLYYFLYGFLPEPNVYMTNRGKFSSRKLNFFDHLVILIPTITSLMIGILISRQ